MKNAVPLREPGGFIPAFYQVHLGERHFQSGPITVLPFERFCRDLVLP